MTVRLEKENDRRITPTAAPNPAANHSALATYPSASVSDSLQTWSYDHLAIGAGRAVI